MARRVPTERCVTKLIKRTKGMQATRTEFGLGKQRAWTDAMIIVSIISIGVIVAGLTNDPDIEADSAAAEIVFEPADDSADIPGCDTVERGGETGSAVEVSFGVEPETYDNPDYPWFDGPRASAMSEALVDSLPPDVELKFAGPRQSLVFQPIPGGSDSGTATILESTSAMGTLVRDGAEGMVTVYVAQDGTPAPPCVAGALDSRQTEADGTVVDTRDTWYEYAGQRTAIRDAVAYTPDGSRVSASTAGADRLVLSVEELADMVLLPELRTTYSVPSGTVAPPTPCTVQGSTDGGIPLTREVLAELNESLNTFWDSVSRSVTLDRPLGSLQLDQYSPTSACADLVYGAAQTLTVSVTPTAGSYDNDPDRSYPGYEQTSEMLPDGSVLRISGIYVTSPTGWPQQTVSLETVSGMKITVRASDRAVGLDLLRSVAQTAGSVFA